MQDNTNPPKSEESVAQTAVAEKKEEVVPTVAEQQQPEVEASPLVKLLHEKEEALKHFLILVKVQNPPIPEQVAQLIQREIGLKFLRDNIQSEITVEEAQVGLKKAEQAIHPTQEQINERIAEINDTDNESSWTDATESIAADDEDDVWMVDDDIIAAMEIDSQEDGDEEEESKEAEEGEKQKKDEVDLEVLEEQFVKGKESNEEWRVGFHQKFCTSVNVTSDGKTILTGGGDDRLLCFREINGQWEQVYRFQHGETVSKIEVSNDSKYVVSLTEKEVICTELATFESRKLDVEDPTDILCHKQGGVVVAAHGYSVSIFNLKGLDLFATYCLDLEPSIIALADSGKQLVAACDNKVRIISPKTGEITKVGGADFHREEISAIATAGNLIVSGCIQGRVYSSNLVKGNILGSLDQLKGSINSLCMADNYVVVGVQQDGLHWVDLTKMKRIFHNPQGISASDIVQVQTHLYAAADLEGAIHLIDRRSPMNTVGVLQAGNTVHHLTSLGSQLYAACEDGYVRVWDVSKLP